MQRPSKNIVIFSDGTGQTYHGTESNVWRLYNLSLKDPADQIIFYSPGIGTHPRATGFWGRLFQHHIGELLLGHGVLEDVTGLYRILMEHYEPEDCIFLFGFSRGAFTVRALAGLIHICGLLRRDDLHLVPDAIGLYQTSEARIRKVLPLGIGSDDATVGEPIDHGKFDAEATKFKQSLSRDCKIAFLGIWDTVKAYGWVRPRSFPALRHNPSVAVVRHAVALDEQRAVFQMTGWGDRHKGVKEVWFAGDHSDVGGGHPQNSPLADAAMTWMMGEAVGAGLLLDPAQRASVECIVRNSGSAPSTESNNLLRGWFWTPPVRMTLNNEKYPPSRWIGFWPKQRRKPFVHDEKTRSLCFHHTVNKRGAIDPAYRSENLLGGRRDIKVNDEPDGEIVWLVE